MCTCARARGDISYSTMLKHVEKLSSHIYIYAHILKLKNRRDQTIFSNVYLFGVPMF